MSPDRTLHLPLLILMIAVGSGFGSGCSGGSSSSTSATGASTVSPGSQSGGGMVTPGLGNGSGTGTGTGSGAPAVDFAALAQQWTTRREAYLQQMANGFGGKGENIYTQLARLDTGIGPIKTAPLTAAMDFMDSRKDTADFKCAALLRVMARHGTNPMIPIAIRTRAKQTLLDFKYWIDEPGTDEMIFWSENHFILFSSCDFIAGKLYPTETFSNDGRSGAEHAASARPRVLRWLNDRLKYGFSEWYSPVYYPHDVAPLCNLIAFANDAELQTRARMVLDLLLFDLARLAHKGSFGVTAGRAYEEHKWSGRRQSIGDTIELLWGSRGEYFRRGTTGATALATTPEYDVPHVLLGIGRHVPERMVDRARMSVNFSDAASEGIGFSSPDDAMFWWGRGGYVAPESIVLTRRKIRDWDLWHYGIFKPFESTKFLPDFLLPTISNAVSPITEGSLLSRANLVSFRTPDGLLSSVQNYRKGQIGYQQHAWQATFGLDASVWTTAPASFGRMGPGEWTGSGSMPRVVQVEDTAVILYNPPIGQRLLFPARTHAWFPKAAFDEVITRGDWTFARKGDGYLGLYSARATFWQTAGPHADNELIAEGPRNVWICQLGRKAEDGHFGAFMNALESAAVTVTGEGFASYETPLTVQFDAPGIGALDVAFKGAPTRDGAPIAIDDFPRFDNPYAQKGWKDTTLNIRYAGATLFHDQVAGLRSGDGL